MCSGCFSASKFGVAIYKDIVFYKSVVAKTLLIVLPESLCDVNYSHKNLKSQTWGRHR